MDDRRDDGLRSGQLDYVAVVPMADVFNPVLRQVRK